MFQTIGHLISELMSDFGGLPAELLSPKQAFEALNESFAARGLQAQQSPQGRTESALPLTLGSRDVPLPPTVQIPLWLEMKTAAAPYTTWTYVPWVNQAIIEESRTRGDLRCSFYRDANTKFWHLVLSYDPIQVAHQLWHAGDVGLVANSTDTIPFETTFAVMFKLDAQISLIPKILQRWSNLPEDRLPNSAQLAALNATLVHAQSEVKEKWEPLWFNRNRAGKEQRGRARRPILGRGFSGAFRRTY